MTRCVEADPNDELPSYWDCYERVPICIEDDERAEACPKCGGDGGWDYPVSMCHIDGSITYGWDDCTYCDGTGEIAVELLPITLDDLEEMCGEVP